MNDKHINDGGPAFPAHPSAMGDHDGMTLRDYFAAKAMAAFIAEPINEGGSGTAWRWASQLQIHTQMSGPDTAEALLRQALDALEYASDLTKLEGLTGCDCPICATIAALRERLGVSNG